MFYTYSEIDLMYFDYTLHKRSEGKKESKIILGF